MGRGRIIEIILLADCVMCTLLPDGLTWICMEGGGASEELYISFRKEKRNAQRVQNNLHTGTIKKM